MPHGHHLVIRILPESKRIFLFHMFVTLADFHPKLVFTVSPYPAFIVLSRAFEHFPCGSSIPVRHLQAGIQLLMIPSGFFVVAQQTDHKQQRILLSMGFCEVQCEPSDTEALFDPLKLQTRSAHETISRPTSDEILSIDHVQGQDSQLFEPVQMPVFGRMAY